MNNEKSVPLFSTWSDDEVIKEASDCYEFLKSDFRSYEEYESAFKVISFILTTPTVSVTAKNTVLLKFSRYKNLFMDRQEDLSKSRREGFYKALSIISGNEIVDPETVKTCSFCDCQEIVGEYDVYLDEDEDDETDEMETVLVCESCLTPEMVNKYDITFLDC